MRLAMVALLAAFCASASGCSGLQQVSVAGLRFGRSTYPQDYEMPFTDDNIIKIRIVRCYWAQTINQMDDLDQAYIPAGAAKMTRPAQNSFLVVELAMTNYGNKPATPHLPPRFEVVSAEEKTYDPLNQSMDMTARSMLGGNINPGNSLKAREVFDVPKSKYVMNVKLSQNDLAWGWQLEPTETAR